MSMLLILISYEQKTQTLEISDVVKTVLARAVWTVLSIFSRQLIFGFRLMSTFTTKDPPPKEPPRCLYSGWRNTTQDVIQSVHYDRCRRRSLCAAVIPRWPQPAYSLHTGAVYVLYSALQRVREITIKLKPYTQRFILLPDFYCPRASDGLYCFRRSFFLRNLRNFNSPDHGSNLQHIKHQAKTNLIKSVVTGEPTKLLRRRSNCKLGNTNSKCSRHILTTCISVVLNNFK